MSAASASRRGYFHQPSICGTFVAFVCEDDVWFVNTAAPDAIPVRLTTDGCCAYPVFSRSGKSVAYSSFVSGSQEVYVVDCDGGPATQLTRFGADTFAVEWTLNDASVIVSSNCKQTFPKYSEQLLQEFFEVSLAAPHAVAPRALGPGDHWRFLDAPKKILIGRYTLDPGLTNWRHYGGGRQGQLWIDAEGAGTFRRLLPDGIGNIESPTWTCGRVFFLMEGPERTVNVHSVGVEGLDVQQHTHFTGLHARQAASDGTRIVLQRGGQLLIYNPATNETHTPSIRWRGPRTPAAPKYLHNPGEFVTGCDLHPRGHSAALLVRGRVFEGALREGPVVERQTGLHVHNFCYLHDGRLFVVGVKHGEVPAPAPSPSPTPPATAGGSRPSSASRGRAGKGGKNARSGGAGAGGDGASGPALGSSPSHTAAAPSPAKLAPTAAATTSASPLPNPPPSGPFVEPVFSDVSIQASLVVPGSMVATPVVLAAGSDSLGLVRNLSPSPTDPRLVFVNHRNQLVLLDLTKPDNAVSHVIDTSTAYEGFGPASWSDNGRYIVYTRMLSAVASEIRLADGKHNTVRSITSGLFLDVLPCFEPEGNFVYFASARDPEPVADELRFDYGFPKTQRLYAIALTADLPSPFLREPEAPGEEEGESEEESGSSASSSASSSEGSSSEEEEESEEENEEQEESGHHHHHHNKDGASAGGAGQLPPALLAMLGGGGQGEEEEEEREIDYEGIQDRIAAFPLPLGRYDALFGLPGRRIMYTRVPVQSAGRVSDGQIVDEDEDGGALLSFDIKADRERPLLGGGVLQTMLSLNGRTMAVLTETEFLAGRAGEEMVGDSDDSDAETKIFRVDFEQRLKVKVDLPTEWACMFDDAWIRMRELAWTPGAVGETWQTAYNTYAPLVRHLASRREFGDVLLCVCAELGLSHVYSVGGDFMALDYRAHNQGYLGAEFAWDERGGYRITSLVRGDIWSEYFCGPLVRLGVGARVGDVVTAIDGTQLTADADPVAALANAANKEVFVTLCTPEPPKPKTSPKVTRAHSGHSTASERTAAKATKKSKGAKTQEKGGKKSGGKQTKKTQQQSKQSKQAQAASGKKKNSGKEEEKEEEKEGAKAKPTHLFPPSVYSPHRSPHSRHHPVHATHAHHHDDETTALLGAPRTYRTRAFGVEMLVQARYRDWVSATAATVHERSNNTVGYIHLPDMEETGLAEFYRYFPSESLRSGLIIDVRHNPGGNISEIVLRNLMQRQLGWELGRYTPAVRFPQQSTPPVLVLLAGEHTSSDGDVLADAFQQLQLGPVVGARTWGGVLSPTPERLADGTEVHIPHIAYASLKRGLRLENSGVTPDIPVEHPPHAFRAHVDPQLERAITEAMRLLTLGTAPVAPFDPAAPAPAAAATAAPTTTAAAAGLVAQTAALSLH